MSDRCESGKFRSCFTWRIENILWNVYGNDDVLVSPEFEVRIDESCTKWCLRLYTGRSRNYIACYLRRLDNEEPKTVSVGFDVSCITADGQTESVYFKDNEAFVKDYNAHVSSIEKWRWVKMLEKKSLYFPNDSFTIRCQMWSCCQFLIHPVKYFATTHLEVTSISYYKGIPDSSFSDLPIKCYPLPCDDLEIILNKKEGLEYLSVEFRLTSSKMSRARFKCKLNVQDSRGIPMHEREEDYVFSDNNNVWKFPDFIKANEVTAKQKHFENALKLKFVLLVHSGKLYSQINEVTTKQPLDDLLFLNLLSKDLEVLYSDKRYVDVNIKVGKETFPAHKLILRARSPVFAAMFEHDMVEKETSVIQIDDVEAVTFDNLLSFLYSGVVKNINADMAMKLLPVADKYQVLPLKIKCADFLKNIISAENVLRVLQLGDTYHEETLCQTAQKFVCDHHREIFLSEEWRLFTRHHAELASEIIQKLSVRYTDV